MSINSLAIIQKRQFWIFQLLGWSVWVLVLVLLNRYFVPPAFEYIFPIALVYIFSASFAVLITSGLRLIYKFVWDRGFIIRFLTTWFASFFAAMIWQPFHNYIALLPYGDFFDLSNADAGDMFDGLLISAFPTMLLWSALYISIKYYQLFQLEKDKSLRFEALAHEAQLLMLRYQLNPHFLFNTLNAISTLVLSKSNEQANEMLTKLSKFLRYSLDHSPLDKVSLAHEMDSSHLYLDIEKVRFADRLRLNVKMDSEAERALVPTMLLQPIIENSIKHGLSKQEAGGTINISAQRQGNRLVLKVTDDGPGLSDAEAADEEFSWSKGVGVSNIRNRLREIYGDDHELVFSNAEPHGLTVTVVIPYDTE